MKNIVEIELQVRDHTEADTGSGDARAQAALDGGGPSVVRKTASLTFAIS